MIIFPNCKINLGLHVLRKRNDNYHELETVFYPLPFTDVLEVIQQNKKDSDPAEINLSLSGLEIETVNEKNLCFKAYYLLKKDFPALPSVQIHLHKVIPPGAGLAGGSADGTFTLKLLNQKFSLRLTTEKLIDYSLQLGSDCPFFIINKPCLATGRGEFLETISLDLSSYKFVLVYPGIHMSTTHAFSLINPRMPEKSINEIIKHPIESWKNDLKNDFEEPVFKVYPEIKGIKEKLYETGAVYASMTGSGSTIFGIYKKEADLQLNFPKKYLVKILLC